MPDSDAVDAGLGTRLKAGFIDLMLAWPRAVLACFAVMTAVLGWFALDFEIDASPDTLLTQGNELYIQTQQINQRYAPEEFLLLTYEPRQDALLSEQSFARMGELADAILQMERVESVRSILNVPVFANVEDVQALDDDLGELTIERGDFDVQTLSEAFADHPVYENLLINPEQSAAALQILFAANEQLRSLNARVTALNARQLAQSLSDEEKEELASLRAEMRPLERELQRQRANEVEQIRAIIAGFADDADIRLGGVHALGYQLIEIISNDLLVFGLAIGVIICVLLLLLFRALRWVLIPVVCCASSVLCTMGLFALLDLRATVISSNFIALQLILTLAIVIHLIVQYREQAAADGAASQKALVRETLMRKIGPCFLAGLTTSVGFGSLVFSGIQPVIMFGWMMIIAMGFSIAVSLVLFPVLVLLLPTGPARKDARFVRRVVGGFRYLVLRRGGVIGVASIAILAAGVSGAMQLSVENSFINYFKSSTQVHQELAYIDQSFGGTTPLDIIYDLQDFSDDPDIVLSADAVLNMQRIQQHLHGYEATGRILSPVNLTGLARRINNDQPLTEYELTALYWLMDDAYREELIGGFFDQEQQQVRFNVWIQDLTEGLDRQQLLTDIRAGLDELGVSEEHYVMTNMFMLYQDIMQRLFDSQVRTLGIVYVALTLMFLVIFRSLATALVAIAPNILSTAAIFGVMGWAGVPLDLMTITIAAIVMGIAVDDTIHYVHRYREELRDNDADQAVVNTHDSVGLAILYTTVIIAVGFSLLMFSDFVPSMIFGLLTALAMLMALIADLCLLPLLLRKFVRQ